MEQNNKRVRLYQLAIGKHTCIPLLTILMTTLAAQKDEHYKERELLKNWIKIVLEQISSNRKVIKAFMEVNNDLLLLKRKDLKQGFPITEQLWWPGEESNLYSCILDKIIKDFLVTEPDFPLEVLEEKVQILQNTFPYAVSA